jgi:hypothetical protein
VRGYKTRVRARIYSDPHGRADDDAELDDNSTAAGRRTDREVCWGIQKNPLTFEMLSLTNLVSLRRRWTARAHYSSKSAYDIQFRGTYCTFNNKAIWRAKAEEKHRLFAWLLIQNKILTADLLQLQIGHVIPFAGSVIKSQKRRSISLSIVWMLRRYGTLFLAGRIVWYRCRAKPSHWRGGGMQQSVTNPRMKRG